MDEDENLNKNLDVEPYHIRKLGVYLRMLNQGLSIHKNTLVNTQIYSI